MAEDKFFCYELRGNKKNWTEEEFVGNKENTKRYLVLDPNSYLLREC